jgi:uncharacterized membrane protein (DUF373 family)
MDGPHSGKNIQANNMFEGDMGMLPVIKRFEKIIIRVLVVLMAFVLLLSTVELAWVIIKDIITPPILILEIDELLEIFGLFMLVLIGIELLETIAKTYMAESVDHAQIVMAVAIIAIARKVIILDIKDLSGLALVGIAAIILALSIGYYLIKKKDAMVKESTHDAL